MDNKFYDLEYINSLLEATPEQDPSTLPPLDPNDPNDPRNLDFSSLTIDDLTYILELVSPLTPDDPTDDVDNLLTITINDRTYTHIDETESFSSKTSSKPLTALSVMKESFPDTKSFYRRITPPPQLYLFGNSTRRKIIRCVQLATSPPPITPQTQQFIHFFKYLASSPHVGNYFAMNQYYSASLYAANYNHELAAALMLYYGWPPDFKSTTMGGTSIHSISRETTGLTITIARTHTLQNRLNAACSSILAANATATVPPLPDQLIKVGMPAFYSYNNTLISVSSDIHTIIQGKMISFIEEVINPLSEAEPIYPSIEDPDDFLPDQTIHLPFSAFIFSETISSDQSSHIAELALKKTAVALSSLPPLSLNTIYTTAELRQYVSKNILTSSVKKDLLIRRKRGEYEITSKFIEVVRAAALDSGLQPSSDLIDD